MVEVVTILGDYGPHWHRLPLTARSAQRIIVFADYRTPVDERKRCIDAHVQPADISGSVTVNTPYHLRAV